MVDQNMFRKYICSKIGIFRKKIGFNDSFDEIKCLQQIARVNLFQMCAPCSELPYNINTMG